MVICVVMAVLVVSAAAAAEGARLGKSMRLQVAAGGVVAEDNDETRGLLPKQRTAPSGPNGMQSPYVPRAGQIQRLDPAEYDLPEPPPPPRRLD
ncbi:hypothetical protein BHE74_00017412 [Ensete ventricosum]|nr:hypothetical protein B296_00032874 [Ensete ventricosum]RWW74640.1 hypothetical protein BHE74_00017412 [Ensete ventricosum]RZR96722.1 hypothetical protein BHM03_00025782 [Ensete ventricosum]